VSILQKKTERLVHEGSVKILLMSPLAYGVHPQNVFLEEGILTFFTKCCSP
jgi:hypothetical protein